MKKSIKFFIILRPFFSVTLIHFKHSSSNLSKQQGNPPHVILIKNQSYYLITKNTILLETKFYYF